MILTPAVYACILVFPISSGFILSVNTACVFGKYIMRQLTTLFYDWIVFQLMTCGDEFETKFEGSSEIKIS